MNILMHSILFFGCILHVLVYSEEPKCNANLDYQLLKTVLQLEQKLDKMETLVQKQQDMINKLSTDGNGAVYVRWGRNVCPDDSSLVYSALLVEKDTRCPTVHYFITRGLLCRTTDISKAIWMASSHDNLNVGIEYIDLHDTENDRYTAGKNYNKKGSGSDTICLPSTPTWSNYTGKSSPRGLIFGTEIDLVEPSGIFSYPVSEQDTPCVVCRSQRSTVLMVPAHSSCFAGWHVEYTGYLMAGMDDRLGSYNHICMDSQPEFIPNGSTSNNQHILYLVQAQCGSLPCPPYVKDRELACAVCSK